MSYNGHGLAFVAAIEERQPKYSTKAQ